MKNRSKKWQGKKGRIINEKSELNKSVLKKNQQISSWV